jgi:hypothetical protein
LIILNQSRNNKAQAFSFIIFEEVFGGRNAFKHKGHKVKRHTKGTKRLSYIRNLFVSFVLYSTSCPLCLNAFQKLYRYFLNMLQINIKTIPGFFALLFIIGLMQCKSAPKTPSLTGNISEDLNALFTDGTMEVQVMDSTLQSSREIELSYRMQQALEKNKDWYNDYVSQYRESRVLPYHQNFGLSAAEYTELMQMKLNVTLAPSSTQKITIKKTNGIIQFNSDGKLPYLDGILINTTDNTIIMDRYALHFTDTVFVANENHGLKSMWKGYNWRYSEPAEGDTISDMLNTKHYSISVGQLFKTGNTLLVISKLEETDGASTLKFNKPLVFRKL